MDASRKAIFRSRLRQAAERRERIDSPLARYNDLGELVCKVCNVPIKTEALWGTHLGSRQHREAAEELKERAKRLKAAPAAAPVPPTRSVKVPEVAQNSSEDGENAAQEQEEREEQQLQASGEAQREVEDANNATKDEAKGPLPEGFFDNAAADMKARGLEVPKINMQEELEQFHKLIEEDVKAVDDRYLEEEAESAEVREEEADIEQSLCIERVEVFKKRKLELGSETVRDPKPNSSGNLLDELPSDDDDDESDDDTVLNWRTRR